MANITGTNPLTGVAPVVKSMPQGVVSSMIEAALPNTLAAADTVTCMTIPANAYLVDLVLECTDIDTNGTPTVVLDVGIASNDDLFIAASTIGQAGGVARCNVAGALQYTSTSDYTIIVTVDTVAATKAAGTLKLTATYTMDP